jgi:hypothetical protein
MCREYLKVKNFKGFKRKGTPRFPISTPVNWGVLSHIITFTATSVKV